MYGVCAVSLEEVGMLCCGMVWHRTVWICKVRFGMVLYDLVCYCLVWYVMVWYGFVWHEEESGDTLSLNRDQLYGPSLLLSIVAIIPLLTMIQIVVAKNEDEKSSELDLGKTLFFSNTWVSSVTGLIVHVSVVTWLTIWSPRLHL